MSASWPEHRTSSSRNVSDTGPNLGLMIFTLGNTNCHLGGWFDKKYIYRDWLSVDRNMVLAKYQCSQCEYKATQKCNLQTHKKSIHEHEKFYNSNIFPQGHWVVKNSSNTACTNLISWVNWGSFEEPWHQNAASGEKWIKTPSEKLTSSGVLMSCFFKGLPLEFLGFQFYSYETKYGRKL